MPIITYRTQQAVCTYRGEQVPYEGCTDARYFHITTSCVWEASLLCASTCHGCHWHAAPPASRTVAVMQGLGDGLQNWTKAMPKEEYEALRCESA